MSEKKLCRSCRQELPLNQFHTDNQNRDNLKNACKQCNNSHSRETYAANVARERQRKREYFTRDREGHYRRARKRRAVVRGLPHVAYTAQEILTRDNQVCVICGFDVDTDNFHIEHIIPLQADMSTLRSLGVTEHPGDTPWNVSVAHPSCNSSKGNRVTQEHVACYFLWQYLYGEQL